MKGNFHAYVLWPLDFTVFEKSEGGSKIPKNGISVQAQGLKLDTLT